MNTLANFPQFLAYAGVCVALLAAFIFTYMMITPYNELADIALDNQATSIAFGGAILGFAIPIGQLAAHSPGILELLVWGVVSWAVQLIVFGLIWLRYRDLAHRIHDDHDKSIAWFIAFCSVAAGVINAGCVAY